MDLNLPSWLVACLSGLILVLIIGFCFCVLNKCRQCKKAMAAARRREAAIRGVGTEFGDEPDDEASSTRALGRNRPRRTEILGGPSDYPTTPYNMDHRESLGDPSVYPTAPYNLNHREILGGPSDYPMTPYNMNRHPFDVSSEYEDDPPPSYEEAMVSSRPLMLTAPPIPSTLPPRYTNVHQIHVPNQPEPSTEPFAGPSGIQTPDFTFDRRASQ